MYQYLARKIKKFQFRNVQTSRRSWHSFSTREQCCWVFSLKLYFVRIVLNQYLEYLDCWVIFYYLPIYLIVFTYLSNCCRRAGAVLSLPAAPSALITLKWSGCGVTLSRRGFLSLSFIFCAWHHSHQPPTSLGSITPPHLPCWFQACVIYSSMQGARSTSGRWCICRQSSGFLCHFPQCSDMFTTHNSSEGPWALYWTIYTLQTR